MDHLSTLDAGFLHAEDSDSHISLAIGGLSILDGPMPDFTELADTLADRAAAIPRLRQVLRTHRLDLEAPEFDEPPGLNLHHQIKHVAVPLPGDDAALFRLTADIIERRLDRAHPLWECWVIEGLRDDRWAILMKVHHCIADGVSTARMLTSLSDQGCPAPSSAIESTRTPPPSTNRLPLNPLSWGRAAWSLSVATASLATQAVRGAAELLSGLLSPVASTSLLGPVSTMRRYHVARVSLADVHDVCRAFDVTLNDVALTAVTAAFRAVLLSRGEKPGPDSLRTLVPVSLRASDAADAPDTPDNRVSVMLPLLPVDRANPLDQLRLVHRRMNHAKSSGQKQAGSSAMGAVGAVPFPLTAWTVRTITRLPQRGFATLATNVPGPKQRLQMLGHNMIRMYPIPPIAMQLRIGVAMLSYTDEFTFGVVADYDSAPDVDVLTTEIEHSVHRLAELARRRSR